MFICIQLADFVRIPLEQAGGMISLTDMYYHFNRARGTGWNFINYNILVLSTILCFYIRNFSLHRVDFSRRFVASLYPLGEI